LAFEQRRGGERRREGLHQHLAEIGFLAVRVLGLHGAAASGSSYEFCGHIQCAVLCLEDGAHMGESVYAHAGGGRTLAAGARCRAKLNFATIGLGFLSMIRVSDLRLPLTSGGTRTVMGTSEASSAVLGASRTILPSSA